ncbi:MAG: metal-dependent hydrolase [Candidatus Acidiferrales bacterium]
MDPVTHLLASGALGKAGIGRGERLALPMLLVAGAAPDVDLLSRVAGAHAYLVLGHALAHSLLGAAVLVTLLAAAATKVSGKFMKIPVPFPRAAMICGMGVGAHLLMDLCANDPVELLWPFSARPFSWDWTTYVDPWILAILVAGLLLPALFALVGEEIGEKKRKRGPGYGAIVALAALVLYFGARGMMHASAVKLADAREYHGAAPLTTSAFPAANSIFKWRGVIATANTYEIVEVPVGPNSYFDADRSRTFYKPEASDALTAAENTKTAQEFVAHAQLPLATLDSTDSGYHFEVHDLRFPYEAGNGGDVYVVVELNRQLQVTDEEFRSSSSSR